MATAEQVLGLPEILETIIVQLPVHQIYNLKRISKFWDQLITSSPAIRKATCLRQSGYDPYGTPGYSTPSPINIHPYINGSFRFARESTAYTRFYIDSLSREALQNVRDEFATIPRCQALLVQAYHPVKYWDFISCVLYVKHGVKIADVLDLRDGMKTTVLRYDLRGGESKGLDRKIWLVATEKISDILNATDGMLMQFQPHVRADTAGCTMDETDARWLSLQSATAFIARECEV